MSIYKNFIINIETYSLSSFFWGLDRSSIDKASICFNLLNKDWKAFPCGNINNIPYKVFTKYLFFLGSNKYNLKSIKIKIFYLYIFLLINSFDSNTGINWAYSK